MNRLLTTLSIGARPIAIALLALLLGAAPAGATSEIERIWSFNGGEVAIHATPGGKLTGVVVTPTTFDECAHVVGEEMWTSMSSQSDGSYWGFHQWLFEKSCAKNPQLGPTAWRVLRKPTGQRYLLVCFSEPGGSQPTITASGATTGVTRDCQESAPTGLLPVIVPNGQSGHSPAGAELVSFNSTVVLPKAGKCLARGKLRIALNDPKRDPLKRVVIRIKGKKVADVRGVQRLQQGIVLTNLPSGTYTVQITATTVLDQRLTGKRTYHYNSCSKAPRGGHHRHHRRRRRRGHH